MHSAPNPFRHWRPLVRLSPRSRFLDHDYSQRLAVLRRRTGVLCLLALSSCSAMFPQPAQVLSQSGPVEVPRESAGLVAAFRDAYTYSYEQKESPSRAVTFKDAGFALAGERCAAFFRSIGESQRRFDFARGATVVASTAATGLAAAYGAHPDTILGLTTGFATLLGLGEVAQETILFHPETSIVQGYVETGLQSYMVEANRQAASDAKYDFVKAYVHVLGAQRICEAYQIRALVSAAIAKSALAANSTAARDRLKELFSLRQNADAIQELEAHFGTTLSESTLIGLYWLFVKGVEGDDETSICGLLSALPKKFCEDGRLKSDWLKTSALRKVRDIFAKLTTELTRSLDAEVATLRARKPGTESLRFGGDGAPVDAGGIQLEVVPRP